MDLKNNILRQSIISAVPIIIFIVIVFVLKSDIQSRGEKLISVKAQIDINTMAIGSLAALQVDAEKAKNYSSQIAGYLISEDQLINFSRDMGAIGQQNSMNFNVSYGAQTPITNTTPRGTAVNLTSVSKAKMENFNNFLSLIENSYYFVKLNTLDINQDAGQLNVNLSGQVFSF